jgi:adenosylcobinamide-phosphate synthase
VESVAENTVDAVVAPALWAAAAGAPGALGYRAVNTLDAMVGRRCPRYRRYGWASARLDDAPLHPSPNAGVAEAAFAGALGLRLGGANRYGGSQELRPTLGSGRPAEAADIARATRLSRDVTLTLAGVLLLTGITRGRR